MSQKRIAFVTGGTGFVGSHLVERLLDRGYDEVRCLVRTDPKWLEDLDIVRISGDLSSVSGLEDALRGVTHVYHVAAVTRAKDNQAILRANVEGTETLLRAVLAVCPDVQRVLITSSLAVVGLCDEAVATEETPLNPVSAYGRSKAVMERRLAEPDEDGYTFFDRLPLTVVRPPAVYGPREQDILTFFRAVSHGLCPIIGGGREDLLSLVHVNDLVGGMVEATESTKTIGGTYFLGSREPSTWEEVRDVTVDVIGRKVVTVRIPPNLVRWVGTAVERVAGLFGEYPPLNREKAVEIVSACKACSSARAGAHFGYAPGVSLEEGIRSTIEWYRQAGWIR